jgi:hypothetical protein
VRGEDAGRVGKHEQLVSQRSIEVPSQSVGGEIHSRRGEQVGTSDIADEERVTRHHAIRRGVVRVFVHHDRDRFGGVSRRGEDLETDVAEHEPLTVVQRLDRELDVGTLTVGDDCPGLRGEFEMAAEEVGVDVGLDHPLDRQPLRGRLLQVHADIAPWIDNDGATGRLVTDEI